MKADQALNEAWDRTWGRRLVIGLLLWCLVTGEIGTWWLLDHYAVEGTPTWVLALCAGAVVGPIVVLVALGVVAFVAFALLLMLWSVFLQ